MVCHGLPQEVWTYDGSRWTKKATLATSGNATSKAEWGSEMNVQMMDFMKPPGTTRGQHGHVADGFRTTVQLIQYVILPVLRLSNILRCRKETKLSPSTYMIYMYIYICIYIDGIIYLPCTFIDVIYVILTVLDSLSFIPTCDSLLQQTQRQVWSLTPCPRWTKPPRPRAKTQVRLSLSSMPGMFFRRQSDLSLTFSYLFECSSREKEAVRCIESRWPRYSQVWLWLRGSSLMLFGA